MVNIKVLLVSAILVIIAVIVIFSLVGSSASELDNAGNAITDANNCSITRDAAGIAMTYNITSKGCQNSTGGIGSTLAGQYDLPLNSLFASGGIVFLIFMAVILIIIVGVVLKRKGMLRQ